ncbi:MAG TPA: hypothetical protein VKN18_28735 [Blastocatellia bacterium]|nr:hypothetical protein [Blastocatellia bacterium]
MRKFCFVLNILAVAGLGLTISSVAQAQALRTWVSGVGDDANPCSRTAPCKTFAGAISKTAAGGEIDALDPAGYGAVTIIKAVTIDGGTGSGWASILAAGVNGIIVNAGANDRVILRHISINGTNQSATPGINGIRYLGGKQLNVEQCVIFGFNTNGIDFSAGTGRNLYVKDTDFTNITGSAIGITSPASGFHVANIDRSRMEGNGNGVVIASNCFVTVSNSSIFQNTTNGLSAAAGATINLETVVLAHNGTGVNSAAGSAFRLSNTAIYNNGTGINAGGSVRGFFNNRVFGNGVDGAVNAQTAQQ